MDNNPTSPWRRFKPGVPKRFLLLIAAFVWTFAGGMLLWKGTEATLLGDALVLRFSVATAAGMIFFWLVFSKVSLKHITRIHAIDIVRPCLFSFFDFKGYAMMAVMITGGILLKTLNLVDPLLYGNFLVCMGVPLTLSAARFYYSFAVYRRFSTLSPTES